MLGNKPRYEDEMGNVLCVNSYESTDNSTSATRDKWFCKVNKKKRRKARHTQDRLFGDLTWMAAKLCASYCDFSTKGQPNGRREAL